LNERNKKSVTIRDVAKTANVSVSTVSRVLNNNLKLVNTKTRQNILNVIEQLNFTPNAMARGLHVDRTKTLGLIIQDIANPYYSGIVFSAEDMAQELGYNVILANTQRSQEKMRNFLQVMCEKRVDGVVFSGGEFVQHEHEKNIFESYGVKSIVIGKTFNDKLPSVWIDNVTATKEACECLIKMGHRNIAMITGTIDSSTAVDRSRGYYEALNLHGIPIRSEWTVQGNFDYESGFAAIEYLCSTGNISEITAIFAHNDIMAIGAMKALQNKRFNIPSDISVLGFDDIQAASYVTPTLSSVAIPVQSLGSSAVKNLVKVINGEAIDMTSIFPTKVIVRDSLAEIR
jgi:LacI family transcriptional regulator